MARRSGSTGWRGRASNPECAAGALPGGGAPLDRRPLTRALRAAASPRGGRCGAKSWPPPLSIVRETLRLRVVIGCFQRERDRTKATEAFRRFDADSGVPAAKKAALARFAKRCGL